MSYPPPNPYGPAQQPGYGQQPSQPQHFTTGADPYSRPDPYSAQPGYGPPMNVQPGSVPPGGPAYPPAYQPTQPPGPYQGGSAFQAGQAAPPPPGGTTNVPLLITLGVIVLAVATGAVFVGMTFTGDGEPVADESPSPTEEFTSAEEVSAEPTPVEETTAEEDEASHRLPQEGECLENVTSGFYVVDCTAESAYWEVLHIEQDPADPDPSDPLHADAAIAACDGVDWTQYYYTDSAIAAGTDWDPETDTITAIYCITEVE